MAIKYDRSVIGEGITLTQIIDPKYKTNIVRVRFVVPIDPDYTGANSLLMSLLVTSNSEVPSRSELSSKFMGLYGTSIGALSGNISDHQSMGISMNMIMDKYTIDGEKISEEAVRQLLLCVLSPDIKDGKFNENYFRLRKQELIDNIAASVNDKRSYAFSKAKEIIYAGEPAAHTDLGTMERAESLTQEELMAQYRYLLESAEIDLMICGGGEIDSAVDMLREAFSKLERKNVIKAEFRAFSPLKKEVCEKEEYMDVKQCKMFMAYKSDYEDIYVCKLTSWLLGGSAFSKLFANVREKLSLCYSCDSYYSELKGVMLIESGVDAVNIKKAQEAIREQIVAVQTGDFTADELENTKRFVKSNFMANYDSEWDMAAWYRAQESRGTAYTPEEVCDIIDRITAEQVTECAKSFKEDSVFVLKAKEDTADE